MFIPPRPTNKLLCRFSWLQWKLFHGMAILTNFTTIKFLVKLPRFYFHQFANIISCHYSYTHQVVLGHAICIRKCTYWNNHNGKPMFFSSTWIFKWYFSFLVFCFIAEMGEKGNVAKVAIAMRLGNFMSDDIEL